MATRITKDVVPQLLKAIEDLTRQQVLVGIPGDTPARTRVGVGVSNVTIGYLNEFGSPAMHIPARPFLRPGVNAALPDIIERLRTGARAAVRIPFDQDAGTRALMSAGLIAQRSVRMTITNVIPPPLAAMTLRMRKTRRVAPRQGETPLLDTGQLRNAVTYVIRNKP